MEEEYNNKYPIRFIGRNILTEPIPLGFMVDPFNISLILLVLVSEADNDDDDDDFHANLKKPLTESNRTLFTSSIKYYTK
ncbi:hypothetical protein DERF_007067 [Dermatophagoides farinae]|uniref:Uncharacterized protein n=1 Tax=Dermatophagoides farinae TaxID=6954 RepID=A0A922I1G1_DERFA|nr:hypothetical protein DERF_007067 [Dermatophagoides farinae]